MGTSSQRITLLDSSQEYPQITSDGNGGVIVAWEQSMQGRSDIYAQKIDNNGMRKWGTMDV